MDFDEVADLVAGVPHMRRREGQKIYQHVTKHGLRNVLELGCAHGVSACYLAAAVDENGGGKVVTMDRSAAVNLQPNVHDLAERTGLTDLIDPVFAARSYTCELKRLLERTSPPSFDFVFIDAGHTWDVTGFAFFLVDRLVRSGGWILFDDLTWTVATSPSMRNTSWARQLPEEERTAEQVGDVFDILVSRQPGYESWRDGRWGWAQKS